MQNGRDVSMQGHCVSFGGQGVQENYIWGNIVPGRPVTPPFYLEVVMYMAVHSINVGSPIYVECLITVSGPKERCKRSSRDQV